MGRAKKEQTKWLGQFDKRTAQALKGIPRPTVAPPPPAKGDRAARPHGHGVDKVAQRKKKKNLSNAIMPYKAGRSVLVIGDGNFSWSAALCGILGSGQSVVATCFDSEEVLKVGARHTLA